MNKQYLKAILWKEKICFNRTTILIACFYIFLILGTNLFLPFLYVNDFSDTTKVSQLVLNNGIISSAIIIISIGSVIISQSMGSEKREGILKILLSIQIPPDIIWFAQYIFALICSYILWIISFFLYLLGIYFFYGIHITATVSDFLLAIFVLPAVSALLLAIYTFLFWIIHNQTIQILLSIMPALIYILSFFIMQTLADTKIQFHLIISCAITLFSIGGIFLLARIIKRINIERLSDSYVP